ncbi:MAG TPA: hypothetical protein PK264_14045 [Hyphomicrobiaceae bacterium]|nr:hypothetical protein [Hyphomicrobiaceae bacterium]
MKTLFAALAAAAVLVGPANAKGVFETLAETAPKHPNFVELDRTAPRSVLETLNETAPRTIFDGIRDTAPRSDGVFGDLERSAP